MAWHTPAQKRAGHGRFRPHVFAEIAPHLSPTARVAVALADRPDARARLLAAQQAVDAAGDIAVLEQGLAGADVSRLTTALAAESAALEQSLAPLEDGDRVFAEVGRATRMIALSYLRQGFTPEEAAAKAHAAVAGERYHFVTFNDHPVRIPRPDPLAATAITAGHANVLAEIGAADIHAPKGASPADRRAVAAAIREGGIFVTDDCDQGVVLYGPNGRVVLDHALQPIRLSWDELAAGAGAAISTGARADRGAG